MIKHLSMKPTGWFQIGWSEEIPPGGVKPMKYFGNELVAFRSEAGELAVLDWHCLHMGAHLGYGGKVKGDCIACPYHGWQWNTQGANTLIPYEADHTIRKRLRKWHIKEQHEMIFLWHDPAGGAPQEEWLPNIFDYDQLPANPDDFYPCYQNKAFVFSPGERIHPQITVENAADTMHFRYTHGAPEDPVLLSFNADGPIWHSSMGFISPKTKGVAMRTHCRNAGVGLSFFIFDHRSFGRRLILSCTPIDDETSDLRVTYFFPKDPASPRHPPEHVHAAVREAWTLFEQDAIIWRHQLFIQRPIFAKRDVQAYTALRKWSDRFYRVPEQAIGPMQVVEES